MLKKIFFIILALFFELVGFSQILLQESFDNKVFPSAGWLNRRTLPSLSTTSDLWERVSVSNSPVIATHSGPGMAFFNSYSIAANTKTELITPALNFSTGGTFNVKFWMYRDGNPTGNSDQVEIFVNTSQGAGGTLLATIPRSYQISPTAASPGWYLYSYNIPVTYTSTINYLIFRATSATGNNMSIDDVEVSGSATINCYYPTNLNLIKLTTTGLSISWNSPSTTTPDSYDWEVRVSGGPGSGSTGLINSGNTISLNTDINGLTANTNYEVYLRSNCTSGQSIWIGPLSIKTACTLNTIPFSENFDAVSAPALPNCLIIENRNSGNTWVNTNLSSSSFSPYSSPNSMVFASQTAIAGDDWIYLPATSLSAGVNYRMQYFYKALFAGFSNSIEIKYGLAPVANAMNSAVIYSNASINNTGFQQALFSFTVPQNGIYYIGIHNITPTGALNYQMQLDNIFIDIGPDPNCGIATNLNIDAVGLNSANISWSLPLTGTPTTYDWELRSSGLPGSGNSGLINTGNIVGNTIALNSLAMGTTYKFYLKTLCTNPSYGNWSNGISFTTQTTACGIVTGLNITNITKNGFKATWTAPVISSTPTSYDWEVRTSGSGGSGAIGLVNSGNTTNLFADITGLLSETNYGFYVRVQCLSGNTSSWTFTPSSILTYIINDLCSDALELTVGNGFSTSPLVSNLAGASPSVGLSSSCALLTNGSGTTNTLKDVWFKITIPQSGNVIVQTHTVLISNLFNFNSYNYNNMLIAYSGSCGSLNEIACDRDGAPDDTWGFNTYQAKIALTGRTPGEIIYVRLLPDAINSQYIFFNTDRAGIAAWDTSASVRPNVSLGGNCLVNPIINFGTVINTNNYFRWNPIYDNSGNIVAEIEPNFPVGNLGTSTFVTSNVTPRFTAGAKPLLNRNIVFSPQAQPTSYPSYIRIYYKKEELEQLKIEDPAVDFNFLDIVSTNTLCNAGIFSGAETNFIPKFYGKYGDDYFIQFEVNSLSNFFLNSNNSISRICPGNNITLVSNLSGSTYQWQVNTGSGFINITANSNYTGAEANSLVITNPPSFWYGYEYRCVVNSTNFSNSFKIQFINTWTGAVNTKWETPGNWSCGVIPDANMDVRVNSGNILVESITAICRSLNIKPSVNLSVSNGNKLTLVH
jgi:hypothetical protein